MQKERDPVVTGEKYPKRQQSSLCKTVRSLWVAFTSLEVNAYARPTPAPNAPRQRWVEGRLGVNGKPLQNGLLVGGILEKHAGLGESWSKPARHFGVLKKSWAYSLLNTLSADYRNLSENDKSTQGKTQTTVFLGASSNTRCISSQQERTLQQQQVRLGHNNLFVHLHSRWWVRLQRTEFEDASLHSTDVTKTSSQTIGSNNCKTHIHMYSCYSWFTRVEQPLASKRTRTRYSKATIQKSALELCYHPQTITQILSPSRTESKPYHNLGFLDHIRYHLKTKTSWKPTLKVTRKPGNFSFDSLWFNATN